MEWLWALRQVGQESVGYSQIPERGNGGGRG